MKAMQSFGLEAHASFGPLLLAVPAILASAGSAAAGIGTAAAAGIGSAAAGVGSALGIGGGAAAAGTAAGTAVGTAIGGAASATGAITPITAAAAAAGGGVAGGLTASKLTADAITASTLASAGTSVANALRPAPKPPTPLSPPKTPTFGSGLIGGNQSLSALSPLLSLGGTNRGIFASGGTSGGKTLLGG